MAFDTLETGLAAHLTGICEAQTSGLIEPRMIFRTGTGLIAISRTGGDEQVVSADIDKKDLKALEDHGYVSLATPRNHWFVAVTAKALTEFIGD